MRKIFSFMMATVDGYYEGPNQEFDFWTVDDEFNEFSVEQLDEVDTLVFGRVTYERDGRWLRSRQRIGCAGVGVPRPIAADCRARR